MKNRGYYGPFGGAFIPEILVATFDELVEAFEKAKNDPSFWQEYLEIMSTYSCRPTPLTFAENLSNHFGGARLYIKREDLNHTGAHKANNVMGQGLLVKRMKKTRVIAETGAGQHGVATATMAAKFGFRCTIYMGEVDVKRQRPNVFWMQRLGAEVIPVKDGTAILKDAINEAFRDWITHMDDTHYVLGTACGPHPFPEMVSYFQSIIGQEARKQILEREGRLPKRVYACVGGGSNALGIFKAFLDDPVELVGVEAGGRGLTSGEHASRLASRDGSIGVAQGYKTYLPARQRRPDERDPQRSRRTGLCRGLTDLILPERTGQDSGGSGHRPGGHRGLIPDPEKRRINPGPGIGPCLCPGL